MTRVDIGERNSWQPARGLPPTGLGDALVIVAKFPEAHEVKTRLGASIGYENAAQLYRAFLRDLSERFSAAQATASTAVWRGVPLEAVFRDRGGVKSPGNRVIFHSADGFTSTLPLQDLLQHRALLAWEMNDVALPTRHGFPLRVIVPGYYGEKSAKWIVGIEVVDTSFKDFYEGEGWSGQPLKTRSRIDLPKPGAVIRGPVTLKGIAFAGTRGIRTVEVSTDGGKTWNTATLKPRLSSESWVFWTWRWAHPGTGSHDLSVQAVDGTGASQIAKVEGTVPSGASGYHHVPVRVA